VPLLLVIVTLCGLFVATAQTTEGLISGRITDAYTGAPVPGVAISFQNTATGVAGNGRSDTSGYYALPLLSPGSYRVRASEARYQAQEMHELEVPVAARIDLSFRLRPLTDVWEAGQYRTFMLPESEAVVTFYGPDVDTSRSGSFEANRQNTGRLESTVSEVIDRRQLSELPLAGRDAYAMLLTQPGVTASSATSRGLGLSVNGQRPSASNFLLDGIENNNYLVSGPLTTIAPEALQEYRISTNNFTAEYGRTSGFIANAVSRSGDSAWHGLAYFYMKNDILNANDFQRNRSGSPRTPVKEAQPGFFVGGPLRKNSLFASTAFEYLRFRGREAPSAFLLPTTRFSDYTTPTSLATRLLNAYPAPRVTLDDLPVADLTLSPPSRLDLNRFLALPRVDYISPSGRHRVASRVALSRLTRPNFIWTPYPDFIAPLRQTALSAAATLTSAITARLTNQARAGFGFDDLRFDRPHPEIPTLATSDGTVLPGSPAFYSFRNRTRNWEFADNLLWARGAHVWKFGGGLLTRSLDGYLTAGQGGLYHFQDAPFSFATDRPGYLLTSLSRTAAGVVYPDFNREYRNTQFFLFAQDSYRVNGRLALNYGLRYENFGAPTNVGATRDAIVELGSGTSLPQRLVSAKLTLPTSGDRQLYSRDNNDFGVRAGFSYSLRKDARTLLRGSYGIFYDRPFDNLWQNLRNNDIDLRQFDFTGTVPYLSSVSTNVAASRTPGRSLFSDLTLYQPGIRTPFVSSYFAGVTHQFTSAFTLEVNTLGSSARKLTTTDLINRPFSLPGAVGSSSNRLGYFNPTLGVMHYRANQGSSDYRALTAVSRFRSERVQAQVAYTWSHSIDNQSDALTGEFFNLDFTALSGGDSRPDRAAFSRQFDSRIDRGNSDFDQRQNLVFFSVWELPHSTRAARILRGWRVSQMAAVRSGTPYTVFARTAASLNETIYNNRADLVLPQDATLARSVPGGKLLLNPAAFRDPASGTVGNSGRNAFRGPAFYNLDLSVSRSFALHWLGETGRVTVRADAFNVLNHANLNNPDTLPGSETFGIAQYGRQERSSGFPLLVPFSETARQVQLMLKIEF